MKRLFAKASIGAAGLVMLLLPVQGCTDLQETPISSITPNNFFGNESEVLAGLAAVYAQLRSTVNNDSYWSVSEISTDELVVPTRGQDWYDNGQWIELHNMLWTPTSVMGQGDINGAWNTSYGGVSRANLFLAAVQNATVPNKAAILAEARALRAFYYYQLMDFFGGVPIVTGTEVGANPPSTRREVFDFIESELIAARDSGLPATRPASESGRLTQGAADAILANMYINAGVFTKDGVPGGISASGYNSCQGIQVANGQDACQAAIDASDRILNSGYYQLADSFPKPFRSDNGNSTENIFPVKFIDQAGLGEWFVMMTLHYNQFNPSPWNGFATLAQTYNAFDAADQRRKVMLIGPQVNVLTGAPVNDRQGAPLVFTDSIKDITQATEGEGPRMYKWPADPSHVAQDNGNDFAYFRLGEIYLIKAEAENEQGNAGTALTLLNTLRTRAGAPLLAAVDRQTILNERMFELLFEGKRRQDLIRFGQYTGRTDAASGLLGGKEARPDYYVLMPIPQSQLDANPMLVQNPGY
jgi:starch-binding outer membrane protein, SusD/RagB family